MERADRVFPADSNDVEVHDVGDEQSDEQKLAAHLEPVQSSPDGASVVLAGGDDAVAGVGEGAGEHVVGVALELLEAAAVVRGPQPGRPVQGGGQQLTAVRAEAD